MSKEAYINFTIVPIQDESSDRHQATFCVCCIIWYLWDSRIWKIIHVVMFGQPIKPHGTVISPTPECRCRLFTYLLEPGGLMFSNYNRGTLICPIWMPCTNTSYCSFNTQNFCEITTWFTAVRFRPHPPTLGAVSNTEGFHVSWNWSWI